ncbi:MAG: HEPN domain-containing protein [Ignisphaera sp.]
MNSIAMAQPYLRQAEERIKHAKEALGGGNYPYVVRQCREAVELLLKASLRLVGVEVPKWHDVGPVLRREANRFPEWFQAEIPILARIPRKLRREREISIYGDEESGVSPDELYDRFNAEEVLGYALQVYSTVLKLIQQYIT